MSKLSKQSVKKGFQGGRANRRQRKAAIRSAPNFCPEALEPRLFLSGTTLYSFPVGVYSEGITVDSGGNVYGTTQTGQGTIYELAHGSTTPTTLYTFNNTSADGEIPQSIGMDSSGNLYGITLIGGTGGNGTIWELAHGSSTITILYSFPGSGINPNEAVVDAAGDVFGTSISGGTNNDGAIWELAHGSSTLSTLYLFTGGANGLYPAGITVDGAGNLYGTTLEDGTNNDGTIWKLANGASSISTLYNFTTQLWVYDMTIDSNGNLYGVTDQTNSYYGSVFELASGGSSISTVYSFTDGTDGATPAAIADSDSNLYLTTNEGGANNNGTIYELAGASDDTPLAPTGVVTIGANDQVSLIWNAVSGANTYNIYRSTTSGAEGGTPYMTGLTGTSFVDTGLTDGQAYYYEVTGVNTVGEGPKSSEATATPSDWEVITPNGQTGDFNGDGTSDLLLENPSTGEIGTWLVHNGSAPTWVNMGTIPTGWELSFVGDFTGNGTTDLLLQNTTTHQFGAWLVNDGAISSWSYMGVLPTGWSIQNVGNYTGNGTDDVMIQNNSTGQAGIWLLNSSAQISSFVNLGTVPTGWQILNPGNMTGSGISDVVLWNQSSGVLGAWVLNSSAQITSWDYITTVDSSQYQVVLGDFNGDGTTDVGALNTSNGQLGCWFVTSGAISGSFQPMGTVPTGWTAASTGDFNDDGITDLLLTNTTPGSLSTDQAGSWLVTLSSGSPIVTWDNIGAA